MSEQPDSNDLISGKETLAHVETRSTSSAKPVFKCQECESIEDIPADVLVKMEKDEPFQSPVHHDKPMQISVVE